MPEMAWFALYISYTLLFLLLTAFDSFYRTTLLVFPHSLISSNFLNGQLRASVRLFYLSDQYLIRK